MRQFPPVALALIALAGCGGAKPAGGPPQPPPAPVEVVAAELQSVDRSVRLLGQCDAVDGVVLTTKAGGIVRAIDFASGAAVDAGQVLLRLDAAREEAAVREAQGERDKAAKELDNRQPLLAKGLVSQDEIDRLKAELEAKEGSLAVARAELAERTVTAPFSGSIGIRRVSLGSYLAPGAPIAPLARLDPLQVAFAVPEVHLAALRPGLAVRASTPAWPGRIFTGTVTAFDPGADTASRSIATVAVLPNPDRALKPGMALTVDLVLETIAEAVTVPERAVVLQGEQAVVWTVVDGKAQRNAVKLGVRLPGRIHIAEGLAAGAQVVVQGLQGMRPGVPVRLPEAKPAPAAAKG